MTFWESLKIKILKWSLSAESFENGILTEEPDGTFQILDFGSIVFARNVDTGKIILVN